jgi:RimJ/RimL family protein N-acetyltransferase
MSKALEPARIEFRLLREADVPLMHRWLNGGEVLRWYWREPATLAEIEQEYLPRVDGQTNVLAMIAEIDGRAAGYVQRYFPRDHPDYWGRQSLPHDTAGIDLFIGEPDLQHRGLGPLMIRAALRDVVFSDPTIWRCIVDPHPANLIAIRAYEKVGFKYLREIGPPDHCESAILMMIERGAVD